MSRPSRLGATFLLALVTIGLVAFSDGARAWDSYPSGSTHSRYTGWAVARTRSQYPELGTTAYVVALDSGANTELHELPARAFEKGLSAAYKIDLEKKRVEHRGTNEGCDDIQGWWRDCLDAYKKGKKAEAYLLLGIILHMIQDMGVPAHANKVIHQATPSLLDHFEFMAFSNYKDDQGRVDRRDPRLDEPWKYYAFSQDWTHTDAPDYRDRKTFPKTYIAANPAQRTLLANRQARTRQVTQWALNSACVQFKTVGPQDGAGFTFSRVHYRIESNSRRDRLLGQGDVSAASGSVPVTYSLPFTAGSAQLTGTAAFGFPTTLPTPVRADDRTVHGPVTIKGSGTWTNKGLGYGRSTGVWIKSFTLADLAKDDKGSFADGTVSAGVEWSGQWDLPLNPQRETRTGEWPMGELSVWIQGFENRQIYLTAYYKRNAR